MISCQEYKLQIIRLPSVICLSFIYQYKTSCLLNLRYLPNKIQYQINNNPKIQINNNKIIKISITHTYMIQNANKQNQMDVLDQQQLNISKNLNILKMDFLYDEKRRLQTQINQLYLNNQLLRDINCKISEGKIVGMEDIVSRNNQLENVIERLYKEIGQLRANIFVNAQLKLQDEKQQKQIYGKYQNKILELRKSIQLKQGSIQVLQQSLNKDIAWTEPTPSKFQMFQQILQLKKLLQQSLSKSYTLSSLNQNLISQNQKLKSKIQKIQQLTMSKYSYIQYKMLKHQNSTKSVPKIKGKQQNRKNNDNNHNRISSNKVNYFQKDNQFTFNNYVLLNNIIRHKNQKIKNLNEKISVLKNKINQFQEVKKTFMHSNAIYQRSRRSITSQANMYQSICKTLYNYLTQRKYIQTQLKRNIQDDTEIPGFPLKLKQTAKKIQTQTKIHCFAKEDWLNLQNSLQNKNQLASTYLNLLQHRKRSYSCVIDYIMTKNIYNDTVEEGQQVNQNEFSIQLEYKTKQQQKRPVIFGSNNILDGQSKYRRKNQVKTQNLFLDAFDD